MNNTKNKAAGKQPLKDIEPVSLEAFSSCHRCGKHLTASEDTFCSRCDSILAIKEIQQQYKTKDGARSLAIEYD